MTTIYLVRHGETKENRSKVIQGRKNNIIDEIGLRKVLKLRESFKKYDVDICYASPLIRTMQTAFSLVGDRCEIIKDKRLIEREMGDLEGLEHSKYDFSKYWDYNLNCNDDGVESIRDVYNRSKDFLDYILEKEQNKKILIVSHGAVIRCMHNILTTKNINNFLDVEITNCYFKEINIK